jgi:hypothetical protein
MLPAHMAGLPGNVISCIARSYATYPAIGGTGHVAVKNTCKESMRSEGMLTQFRVVLYYLTILVYPYTFRLNLDYDFPQPKHLSRVVLLEGASS